METIGDRIKQLRKKENLNQVDFCNRINLGQSRLSEIESNKNKPSYDTLLAIKKEFNISIDWLMTGEEAIISDNVYISKQELSEMEDELLRVFKELDSRDKKEVIAYINMKRELNLKNRKHPSSTWNNKEGGDGEEAATIETA